MFKFLTDANPKLSIKNFIKWHAGVICRMILQLSNRLCSYTHLCIDVGQLAPPPLHSLLLKIKGFILNLRLSRLLLFFFMAGFRKEYLFIIRNYCCKNVVYFSIFSIVHSPIIPPLPLLLFCLGAVINAS